jgi:mono/diheme cytochrome c family protein
MPKYLSVALLAALSSTALLAISQQPTAPKIKEVPIRPTSVTSGQEMYTTYCAVCHGRDGKGMGPAATALKTPPPDLTMLSKKNGGKFPADHVASVLRFGTTEPAHGSAEMPIWADLMHTLHPGEPKGGMLVQQRVKNLTDYLQQMQK